MSSELVINIKDASVYQQENIVLANVNISIAKGEFVYLVGKTGSGKSSLLKVLYGELPLEKGEGMIADFVLNGLDKKQIPFLRRKLGIVFQDFQLLSDRTVYENLVFVMKATGWTDKEKMQKKILEVLESVGIGTKGNKMPNVLSGGEQQRVAIARALINDPDLILADEPTGNLDPETSEEVMKLLFEISKSGKAVLMASHDVDIMQKFPARTLKCENGLVIDKKI